MRGAAGLSPSFAAIHNQPRTDRATRRVRKTSGMGKNNQQRRAAKRKARAATADRPTPVRPAGSVASDEPGTSGGVGGHSGHQFPLGHPAPPSQHAQAVELVKAVAAAVGNAEALDDAVRDLVVFAGTGGRGDPALTTRLATALLLERVAALYENGWQPADIMHVARARLGNRFTAPMAGLLVQQALQQRAPARAPQYWLDQLSALTDKPLVGLSPHTDWTIDQEWGRANAWDVWHDLATLMRHLLDSYPMHRIGPTPSQWPTRRASPAKAPTAPAPAAGHDPKKLATIRALLAKAEATEYAEEADAFTAKAQDLMTRYAIDEALVAEADTDVLSRRVHIDNPYAAAKAQLLATVGRVNRVKAIWDDEHAVATVVGSPVDLELAEMLFTSLLVQATRAMTEAGAVTSAGHRLDRRPSFRRAFLLAYADRIGERLMDAGRHAEQEETQRRGSGLLPVLARRSAAVEREFEKLFPDSRQSRSVRVDARGWEAGRAAADRAVLARGQVAEGQR